MTKEEGLSLGETAHPLKPHKMGPSGALMEGNRATNKFKEFNADRMVSVQFNPSSTSKRIKGASNLKEYCGDGIRCDCSDTNHTFDRLSRDGIPLSSRKH